MADQLDTVLDGLEVTHGLLDGLDGAIRGQRRSGGTRCVQEIELSREAKILGPKKRLLAALLRKEHNAIANPDAAGAGRGVLSLRTGSILGGFLIHVAVAISMDVAALWMRGGFG